MKQPLTPARVAEILGVSRSRVLQLDTVLRPRRSETGVRLYRQDAIDAYAERRAARHGGK